MYIHIFLLVYQSDSELEKAKILFKQYDTDKNGKIEANELKNHLSRLGLPDSDEKVAAMVNIF